MRNIYLLLSLVFIATDIHAQTWNALSSGLGPVGSSGTINSAMAAEGNNIYAGGIFGTAGGVTVHNIAKWDGTAWSDLNGGFDGPIASIAIFKGEPVAAGRFSMQGSTAINSIAIYDGNTWQPLGTGLTQPFFPADVHSIVVRDTFLYAAGQFDTAGGLAVKNLAVYNGTTWSRLGEVTGPNAHINALAIYNGKLVIGGFFDHVDGIAAKNLAMMDLINWTAIGNNSSIIDEVQTLATDGSNLYVGGHFDSIGGVYARNLAKWNGTAWNSFGNPNSAIYAATAGNGKVYVGSGFDSISGQSIHSIAQWDGSAWSAVGNGLVTTGYDFVESLLINNGDLYIGGTFFESEGAPGNAIARYGIPTGVEELATNDDVTMYPNPGNGRINITLKSPVDKAIVDLYNVMGERIYRANLNGASTSIDIGNVAGGVYMYRIISSGGALISGGKYVVQ